MEQATRRRSASAKRGIERLPLFGGALQDPYCDWIEIKTELTYGEQQALAGALWESMEVKDDNKGEESIRMRMDVAYNGPAKLLAWLVDWNLVEVDNEGRETLAPLTWDYITGDLSVEYGHEMHRVINEYVERLGADPLQAAPEQTRTARRSRGRRSR